MQRVETITKPPGRRLLIGLLVGLGPSYWWRALSFAILSGLALAVPTRLVPNDFFSRMTATRPLDYAFWVAGSLLLGLTLAVTSPDRQSAGPVAGGVGTFLAVGCPICNKIVVALLGVSGALTYFAPLQPVIGSASLVLLVVALRRRVSALDACTVPRTG